MQINLKTLQDFQTLDEVKADKMKELNVQCNKTIYGRFTYNFNGADYQFSCDNEAQSNFEKVDRAFEKGRITSIDWTAYDSNGNVVRLTFDATNFEPFYMAHLYHIQSNIVKLRDQLQTKVEGSLSAKEVGNITWE